MILYYGLPKESLFVVFLTFLLPTFMKLYIFILFLFLILAFFFHCIVFLGKKKLWFYLLFLILHLFSNSLTLLTNLAFWGLSMYW